MTSRPAAAVVVLTGLISVFGVLLGGPFCWNNCLKIYMMGAKENPQNYLLMRAIGPRYGAQCCRRYWYGSMRKIVDFYAWLTIMCFKRLPSGKSLKEKAFKLGNLSLTGENT